MLRFEMHYLRKLLLKEQTDPVSDWALWNDLWPQSDDGLGWLFTDAQVWSGQTCIVWLTGFTWRSWWRWGSWVGAWRRCWRSTWVLCSCRTVWVTCWASTSTTWEDIQRSVLTTTKEEEIYSNSKLLKFLFNVGTKCDMHHFIITLKKIINAALLFLWKQKCIVASLRHTCAIIMLFNQHLDTPHLWGGWLSRSLTQI